MKSVVDAARCGDSEREIICARCGDLDGVLEPFSGGDVGNVLTTTRVTGGFDVYLRCRAVGTALIAARGVGVSTTGTANVEVLCLHSSRKIACAAEIRRAHA